MCVCVRVCLFILCCAHALSLTVKQFKFLFCDDATNNNINNCDYNNNTNFWPVMSSCVWCHLAVAIQMKRLGNSKPQIGAKSSACRGASTHASSTRTHVVYALTQQQSSGRARKIKNIYLEHNPSDLFKSRLFFAVSATNCVKCCHQKGRDA